MCERGVRIGVVVYTRSHSSALICLQVTFMKNNGRNDVVLTDTTHSVATSVTFDPSRVKTWVSSQPICRDKTKRFQQCVWDCWFPVSEQAYGRADMES